MTREEVLSRCMELLASYPSHTIPNDFALSGLCYQPSTSEEEVEHWLVDEHERSLWKALGYVSYRALDFIDEDRWCDEALNFVLLRGQPDEVEASSFGVFLSEVLAHPGFPAQMTWYRILLKLYRFLVSSSQEHFSAYAEDVIAALACAASQGQIEGPAHWALRNAVLTHLKRGQLKAICEALDRWHDLLREQSLRALMSVVQGALLLKKRKGVDVEALWSKCAADLEARLDALEVQANPDPVDDYFEALIELYQRLKDHQSAERVWLKRVVRLKESVTLTNQEFGPQVASGFQSRVVKLYEELMSWNGRQGDYRALLREAAEYERELIRRWMGNAERIETRGEIAMEEVEQWLAHLWEGANEPCLRLLRLGCDASGFISRQELLEFGSHEENQPLSARLFGNVRVDQQGRPLRHYTPEQAALLAASHHGRMSLGLYANICLRTAWERILSEDLASPDDLLSLYQGVGLVEEGRERVVGQGFRALFEERYEDAIHLLVPQFEASLRCLYHCVTLHGVRNNPQDGSQQMVTLGAMLEGDTALGHADFGHPERWQDYAHTWFFIFCQEGFGLNLRNDVCHGLWRNTENPAQDAYLILMAMMQLARCAIEAHHWLEQRQDST